MTAMRWQDPGEDGLLEEAISDFLKDITKKYVDTAKSPSIGPDPAVTVGDAGEVIIVVAELPGVSTDELKVVAGARTLTLEGRWHASHLSEGMGLILNETRSGFFKRTLELPCAIKGDEAKAVLENGILEIALPKSEDSADNRRHVVL